MEITATEAVNRFGELLELVRVERKAVAITRYGRVVATLEPPPEASDAANAVVGRSEQGA